MLHSSQAELTTLALRSGADDAVIVSADSIPLDPRIRLKCMIPPCSQFGACGHCPPHGLTLPQVARKVASSRWALFFRIGVDAGTIAGSGVGRALRTNMVDPAGRILVLGAYYLLVYQIVALVEMRSRELGFSPSGFVAGNCREVLCHNEEECSVLGSGSGCRHGDLARPSMETCGVDVFRMAREAGWDIRPIGGTTDKNDIPQGSLLGLILIGQADQ